MARARNIKPSFFTNELLGTYDPIIALCFAGLWCLADREGRLEDRPLRIKAELFPYREGTDVNGYLTVLERDSFVTRYEVDGVRYIQITNFTKHQSPHHTEKPKNIPAPPSGSIAPEVIDGKGVLTPLIDGECKVPTRSDLLIPDLLIADSAEQAAVIPIRPEQQQRAIEDESLVLTDLNDADFARAAGSAYAKAWGLKSAPPIGFALGNTICMRARSYGPAMKIKWWDWYFELCREDEFLNGTKNPGFIAGLQYLVKEENFARVINASHLESARG